MASERLATKEVMRDFPKVELHRHLEGTYSMDKLFEMAVRNKLPVPKDLETFKKENQFPRDGEPDFLLFLSKFKTDWYKSLEDISFITYHAVKTFSVDNLFYIELRFNPEHFAAQNNFDRKTVTKLIIEAANKAASEIGVKIKYLITLNRGKLNSSEMLALYNQVKDVSPDICGFDLAGDESNFPPEMFAEFFQAVKKEGRFKVTIHAGEVSPSSQIWEAIKSLNASRIGHGTSAINDPELQEYLKKHNIALEQCITSNYQTGSWRTPKDHPFGRLFRLGVPVTINSDDPHIQNTDLTDDYLLATKNFNLNLEDLIKANLTALDCSFLPKKEREALKSDYLKAVDSFKSKHKL